MKHGGVRSGYRAPKDVEAYFKNPTVMAALGDSNAVLTTFTPHKTKDGGTRSQIASITLSNGKEYFIKQTQYQSDVTDERLAEHTIRSALGVYAFNDESPFVAIAHSGTFGSRNGLVVSPKIEGNTLMHKSLANTPQVYATIGAALSRVHVDCMRTQNSLNDFYENGCDLTKHGTLVHDDFQASNIMLSNDGKTYFIDNSGIAFNKQDAYRNIRELSRLSDNPTLVKAALEGYLSNYEAVAQKEVLHQLQTHLPYLPSDAIPTKFPVAPDFKWEAPTDKRQRTPDVTTRQVLSEHLKMRQRMPPAREEKSVLTETPTVSQSELTNLITKNVSTLIQDRAFELPSYMQPQDLVGYLLGLTEIDRFLIHRGTRNSQQRPAVGNTALSAQEHKKLLQELQSAFQERGLTSVTPKDLTNEPVDRAMSPQGRAAPSASVPPSSLSSSPHSTVDVTPEFIKRRLNALFDEGVISANFPLEGEKGILKFLFSENAELAKRTVDAQFKTLVSANKQAGSAVQDKKAFLAHAKQFKTVSNLLNREKREDQQTTLPSEKIDTQLKIDKLAKFDTQNSNENVENIDPSTKQNTDKKPKKTSCPSTVYDNTWQDFQNTLNQITINKTDGFITQNAFKKIQHFSDLHYGSLGTAAEKHKRLTELRALLLGINHKNIKNEALKTLITQYCTNYKTLPEVPKRALSWKKN